jgi:glutathione S-transferase
MQYAGAKFTATAHEVTGESPNWNRSAWLDVKPGLKAKNALMNLPYVIDGDNIVTQSNAFLEYLGRKFGLLGSNEGEEAKVRQCMDQMPYIFATVLLGVFTLDLMQLSTLTV